MIENILYEKSNNLKYKYFSFKNLYMNNESLCNKKIYYFYENKWKNLYTLKYNESISLEEIETIISNLIKKIFYEWLYETNSKNIINKRSLNIYQILEILVAQKNKTNNKKNFLYLSKDVSKQIDFIKDEKIKKLLKKLKIKKIIVDDILFNNLKLLLVPEMINFTFINIFTKSTLKSFDNDFTSEIEIKILTKKENKSFLII